jgi:O-antigen/teichoic acid export membrane protein
MTTRLSTNTLTLLVSNGGGTLLSFALSLLIGRVLGQDGLGVYATALAWVFPLSLLADFGLSTLITRDVAQNPDSAADILRDTTPARILLGGGLTLLLAVVAPFLSSDAHIAQGIQISAPLVVLSPFFGVFTAIFRAYRVMWPIAWLNVGVLVAQVVLTTLIFLAGSGVLAALIVNVVTSAGQLAAAWAVWRWKFLNQKLNAGVQRGKDAEAIFSNLNFSVPSVSLWFKFEFLRRAWPFALAGILAAAQLRVSVILLERLTTAGEVGIYAAASRFVEAGRMIPNALFGALFPALATLAMNPEEMARVFGRVMLGLMIFGAALGLIFSLFAPSIIRLTYGDKFLPAVAVLQVAMWSLLPSVLRGARTLYWYAHQRERFVNNVTAASLVLQIALSVWLIPQQGALGVAVVILVVESAAYIALMWGRNVPAN